MKKLIYSVSVLKLDLIICFFKFVIEAKMTSIAFSHFAIGLSISKSMKVNCSLRLASNWVIFEFKLGTLKYLKLIESRFKI